MSWEVIDVTGLYRDGWKGEITPESFSHPAKFARGLIRWIYQFLFDKGLLIEGMVVVDSFGGVGLGAIDAARNGLQWIGVELEHDFVVLSHRNFYHIARKEWCTCDEQGQTYLRSMQEAFRERIGRSQPETQGEERPVLQPELPYDFSELGEKAQEINTGKNVPEGQTEDWGEESSLEGWTLRPQGRLRDGSSRQEIQDGARRRNGKSSQSVNGAQRGGSSQEREPARQSARKFGSDDNLRTHETPSPEWDQSNREENKMCYMRKEVHGEITAEHMQPEMQTGTPKTILEKVRRQPSRFCSACGKLKVLFPIEIQGDSRRLAQVLMQADSIMTSPPFADNNVNIGAVGDTPAMRQQIHDSVKHSESYGSTPGNLGNLAAREGDLDAALTSPPFSPQGNQPTGRGQGVRSDYAEGKRKELAPDSDYGDSPGQIQSMPEGNIESVITSPPFLQTSGGVNVTSASGPLADASLLARHAAGNAAAEAYGNDPAQLAALPEGAVEAALTNEEPDTFWGASRTILAQTYALLRPHVEGQPGGVAVFVCKRYIRDGQIVEFSDNWRRLAESVGFRTLYWIRAWLTTDDGTQLAMDGNHKRYAKKRTSFFRRLHEKKRPDLAIDYEDVIVMCKPSAGA